MKIIAWIVLIIHVMAGLVQFINTFTEEVVTKRVVNFISVIVAVMIICLCIFVLRMI